MVIADLELGVEESDMVSAREQLNAWLFVGEVFGVGDVVKRRG